MTRHLASSALLVSALWVVSCQNAPAPPATTPVERGKYLVTITGCHDCHTPKKMGPQGPEPDMSRMLSGHPEGEALPAPPALGAGPWIAACNGSQTAWSGPWGVSYATNLTPDQDTGMGIWTEQNFI